MLLVLGLVVLLAHQTSRMPDANASIRWFFVGTMLGALGLGLLSFRDVWPPIFTIVAGNFFFLLMVVCLGKAVALLVEYPGRVIPYYIVLTVITTGALAYYTCDIPFLARRILVASIAMPLFLAPLVVLLFKAKRPEILIPARTMAGLFLAHIVNSLLFLVATLRGAHMPGNVRWTGVVLIAGMCLCFLWMDMQRTRGELSALAMTDPLTGLLNRRALELMAPRELAWAARKAVPLTLLTVDIDQFKIINDKYGHMIGDAALLGVSSVLKRAIRMQDLAVRTGGDEFMLLLVDSSEEIADRVIRRIDEEMSQLDLRTHDKSRYALSVSIGRYTTVPRAESSYAELVHASDIDLYRRKQLRSAAASPELAL
ncbi:MAG: GGDEF domain-containing protein [Acidobacteriaceae bacterium]|nr:GGDEF domain-containing protein [Acidobacteriaceae bacterium]